MDTRFAQHLQIWLPAVLRQKAMATAMESAPALIGVADLAMMLCDYVLQTLTADPRTCLNCCGLDDVTERELTEATGFDRDGIAAALIGAVVELSAWTGMEGTILLVMHGVPEEDAVEFAHGAEVVSEKLASRGQAMVTQLAGRGDQLSIA